MVGTFRPRTRTAAAKQDVLLILDTLGFATDVEEVLNMGPTSKGSTSQDDVLGIWETRAVQALRDHQATSRWAGQPLWGQRGRTPAEAARVGPIARAVRTLKTAMDTARLRGQRVAWDVEGSYLPTEPVGVFATAGDWDTETMLIFRDDDGVWRINALLCEKNAAAGSH